MKITHSSKVNAYLAGVAILCGSAFAFASSSENPATAVKNSADQAVSSNPIHYTFDETPLNRSANAEVASYSTMLEKVTPGVVGIYPSTKVQPVAATPYGGRRGRGGYRSQQVPVQNLPPDMTWTAADSTRYEVQGVGSGCIISPDGYIITNHHVVTDDQTGQPVDGLLVKLADGRELEGHLIGSDASTDLALIKVDAKNLPVIKMADSEKIKVGDVVFAVGNPMDVGLTVTHGIVSATGRSKLDLIGDPNTSVRGFEDFIQTDAAINPGNSGGPLVDTEGRLIGLNTAIVSNSDNGGSIGIGFAIPSALVRKVADDLITNGKVRRGAIGVMSEAMTLNTAELLGLSSINGALVDSLAPSGPAANSGLKHGDVIVKVNNDTVDSPAKLRYLVALGEPGSTIDLTVLRDGQSKVFKIKLADLDEMYGAQAGDGAVSPPTADNNNPQLTQQQQLIQQWAQQNGRRYTPAPAPVTPPIATPAPRDTNEILPGVSLMPLNDDLRQQLGLTDKSLVPQGLVVSDVSRNSPFYYDFGNRSVVIVEVNKKPVSSLDDLRALIKSGVPNLFYVYRSDPQGGPPGPAYVTELMPAN